LAVLKLKAAPRTIVGKKVRFLRRQEITPTHLYGHDVESLALQCDTKELQQIIAQAGRTRLISVEIEKDKKPRSVFIREVQRDAITGQLLHVDFYEVKKEEKITVDVPLAFVGEALALKGKGRILIHGITSLTIECLPELVPPQIEVDLSPLVDTEAMLLVKHIKLSPEIIVRNDPEQLVAKVSEVVVKEEVVAAPEVAVAAEAKVEAEAKAEAPAEEKKPGKAAEKPSEKTPPKP